MLSKIMRWKRWVTIIISGIVFGMAFYFAVNWLPSKYADLLFYAFGLQYAAAVLLIDVGSVYYFIVSVTHFSILSWLLLTLIEKNLSISKWLMITACYLAFSVIFCLTSAYIFFHYIMDIGGKLPIKGN